MDRKTRIAVVGAGLGGMTVAGFLQRAGFSVTIYEQAPAFSRIGAGIILSANVMKVLRRLGLEQMVVDIGIKADCYVSRAWDTGETMYKIDFDADSEARFGGPYANIHRGDLHAVLEKGVAPGSIAFNHRLVALDETRDAIGLVFDNGARVEADIVIGADGVNSKVREYLLGVEPPRYIGMAAHRAIFPTAALRGFKIPDCTKWWGPDRHILVYFMTSRRDEVYVIGVVPRARWESEAASLPSSRDELFEGFGDFHADLLPRPRGDHRRDGLADLRSRAQRPLERRTHRAARRCLPSDAPLHGGRRCHGHRGCRHSQPLPRAVRPTRRGLSLVRSHSHRQGRRRSAHFHREQLDARSHRHRLVLLLRSLYRAAPSTSLG